MIISILIVSYIIYFSIKEYNHIKLKKMRELLSVGDCVVTSGGVVGIIRELDKEWVLISVEPNKEEVKIEKDFIVKSKSNINE